MLSKKTGFSLVETMVVIVIMMVVLTAGVVYFNSFNAKQKLDAARNEIIGAMRAARNLAITRQSPMGVGSSYVVVTLTNQGVITAGLNGVGTTFFSKDITAKELSVSALGTTDLWFAAGSGKLIRNNGSVVIPVPDSTRWVLTIGTSELSTNETRTVIINASGLIDEK